MQNVRLTLNLPKGLSLAVGKATQVVGNVRPGAGQQVSWRVMASRQLHTATLTYAVRATAQNARTKLVQAQITLPAIFIVLKAPAITVSPAKLWSGDQLTLTVKTVPGASIVADLCCVLGAHRGGGSRLANGDLWMRGATADQSGTYTWRIENLAMPVDSKVSVHVTVSGPGARAASAKKGFVIRFNAGNGAPPTPPHAKTAPYNPAPGMGYTPPRCGPIIHAGVIEYAPLDAGGRATGACAEISRGTLHRGAAIPRRVRQTGCYPADATRVCDTATLIASFLGGNGKSHANLVYTTAEAHSFGLNTWENAVRAWANGGRTVVMNVTAYYAGSDDVSPTYIDIYAQQIYGRAKTVTVDKQQVTTKSCRLFLKRIYNTPVATTQDLPAGPRTYWCPGLPTTFHPK